MTPLVAVASAFLFLSPTNTAGYKVVQSIDRPVLERSYNANERPLVVVKDDVFALTNVADVISAAAFVNIPRHNLIHTWRGLGVKVLSLAYHSPEESAEYFRRSCAFLPFSQGAEGVYIANPQKLTPAFMEAFEEAKIDAEVLWYLKDLKERCAAHKDPRLHMEARRISYWFGYMEAEWEDLDCLRLECIAYIRRLEQHLGLPERKFPLTYNVPKYPNTAPYKPFESYKGELYAASAVAYNNDNVALDKSGSFRFFSNTTGFTFSLVCTNGPVIKQWASPEGKGKFHLTLHIPSKIKGEYLPYHFEIDPWNFTTGPRAKVTAALWPGFLYSLDERFTPYAQGYGISNPRIFARPKMRTYSPDYPPLFPSFMIEPRKEGGGWVMKLVFSWFALYEQWPATENNVFDKWYVSISHLPDGSKIPPCQITWPRGREVNANKIKKAFLSKPFADRYSKQLKLTETVWNTSFASRLYEFVPTAKPTFDRYNLESDQIFLKRVLQPVLDANKNSWDLVRVDKIQTKAPFDSSPENVKESFLKAYGRLFFMAHDVGKLRRDYLVDRFAGKLPPEPKPGKNANTKKGKVAAPSVDPFMEDDGGFDNLELDEMEF